MRSIAVFSALLLVTAVAGTFVDPFVVDEKEECSQCVGNIIWDPNPQYFCDLTNTTMENAMCAMPVFAKAECISRKDNGVQYAGRCGCPNNCLEMTDQGTCVEDSSLPLGRKCQCKRGYTGADCSQISMENDCNGQGEPETKEGRVVCACAAGWTGLDCTTQEMLPYLPPIVETVPSTQYSAQDPYGLDHPVFNQTTIGEMFIDLPWEDYFFLVNGTNKHSDDYKEASFWFSSSGAFASFDSVGFRIRGGWSRSSGLKSFKVSFGKFLKGQTFYGEKKLNLKMTETDNSALRDPVVMDTVYSMNSYVQRYGMTKLYVNGIYMGVYYMMEPVDELFLKSRFGNADGALYKCVGTLNYFGSNPNIYKNLECGDKPCYDPKTDAAESDSGYVALTNFLTVLNNANITGAAFREAIEDVFDVDLFLRTLAAVEVTGSWDGLFNGNNYYLLAQPDAVTNKTIVKFIRHDFDSSLGVFPRLINMTYGDPLTWGTSPAEARRPFVFQRFLQDEVYGPTLLDYLKDLLHDYVVVNAGSAFDQRFWVRHKMMAHGIMQSVRILDGAFTYQEFRDAWTHILIRPQVIPDLMCANRTKDKPELDGRCGASILAIGTYLDLRINSMMPYLP